MELEVGSVVFSKAGRDKGKLMSVVEVKENCVFVCDGKERPVERPKMKNLRHISITAKKLEKEQLCSNRRLKKALREISQCCE